MMLEMLPAGAPATLAWAVLLHDVGKPPTFRSAEQTGDRIRFDGHAEIGARMSAEICRRLRFSTDDSRSDRSARRQPSALQGRLRDASGHAQALCAPAEFRSASRTAPAGLLCPATASWTPTNSSSKFLRETPPDQVRPPRLITGDDLSQMGLRPGPQFKEILESVEEAQLDGRLKERPEALEFVRSKLPEVSSR